MREILFRGKRLDNGEWVYGSFIQVEHEDGSFTTAIFQKKDAGGDAEVSPATVGQYNGLTDKNGVNIFEGDIVDLFGMKGKIVQECGSFGIGFMKTIDYDLLESQIPFNNSANFCFNDNFISLWEVFWNYEQDDNPLYEVEVIGNIHDNPELLEGGNDE